MVRNDAMFMEPSSHLEGCMELVKSFNALYESETAQKIEASIADCSKTEVFAVIRIREKAAIVVRLPKDASYRIYDSVKLDLLKIYYP